MGWFDRGTKEQETEEQFVAEEVEGDDKEEGVIFFCPFCNEKIRKVIVMDIDDQDNDNVRLIGCPNCRKVIGGKTDY